MNLVENWQAILTKAWSIKFTAASLLLSALEVWVQLVQPAGIPGGIFAGIAGAVSLAAGVARLLAQQEVSGGAVK
ncbi:hypothetical protein [Massilia sp. DWR3-1-1]|uniref:DUF7940 domain-containing protein n=1 Tax=Massilia sp. DWR3-1-1 TaxID=2804559 RepID=UPI003CF4C59D